MTATQPSCDDGCLGGHHFFDSCYVCTIDGVSLDDEKLELLDLLLLELPEDDPELDAEPLGPVVPPDSDTTGPLLEDALASLCVHTPSAR